MSTRIIAIKSEKPKTFKQSHIKLWIRTLIAIIFATIFSFSLYPDIKLKLVPWSLLLTVFLVSQAIGLRLSALVPMQVHMYYKIITISFDKIYFTIIFLLVGMKFLCSRFETGAVIPDILMVIILGLMFGRLIGIFLKIKKLKSRFSDELS